MKKISILFGMALLMAATLSMGTGSASAATRIGGNQGKLSLYAVDGSTATNMPVAGAAVSIFDANGQPVPGVTDAEVTDANGMFSRMLNAGAYTVKVTANGYEGFITIVKITPSQATNLSAKLVNTTHIAPPPVPCLSCDASPCLTCVPPVQGKFTIYVVDGSSATNMPVAGAAVSIFDADEQRVPTTRDATDANGMFTTELDEGTYTVKVTATGYDGFTATVKITSSQPTNLGAKLVNTTYIAPPPTPCLSCDPRF